MNYTAQTNPSLTPQQAEAFTICSDNLRTHNRALWLADLFVPEPARQAIHALQAFALEVLSVRAKISEPMPGELRLTWLSDALGGLAQGREEANTGHPLLIALSHVVQSYGLPLEPLQALIEAARFDLYDDPMPDMATLEGYCGETQSALLRLATLILMQGAPPVTRNETEALNEACGHGGMALGLTRLLATWGEAARRGQCFVPRTLLKEAGLAPAALHAEDFTPPMRAIFHTLLQQTNTHFVTALVAAQRCPPAARPAFMPLGLVSPHLRLMSKMRYNPYRNARAPSPLALQWALWRFAKKLS